MNNNVSKMQCAACHTNLTWWNAATCAQCGHAICRQHMHVVKRAHSHVLVSICSGCANYAEPALGTVSVAQAAHHAAHAHQHASVR